MQKQESTMQSYKSLIIFFIIFKFNYVKNKFNLKRVIFLNKTKNLNKRSIFLITRSKNFVKFYIIFDKIVYRKSVKKKFIKKKPKWFKKIKKYKRRRRFKKYIKFYFRNLIKALFIKLKILLLNKKKHTNLFLALKFKKINLKNLKRRKRRIKRRRRNTIRWFYFILYKNFFKNSNNFRFLPIYNKSHSKLTEKSKKLRRK